ncbi:MAG: AzlD domain-containing protein [Betaproteobacteria bacterium]|nr:AzlD domain-containing protein [Betaproteobacteria bacterium]
MIDSGYALGVIAATGLVTFGLRALPFVAAEWLRRHPLVPRLGRFLPLAIMTILLLHSIAGAASAHAAGPGPELLAAVLVMLLQWWRRNALLSILTGTVVYVLSRNLGWL